MATFSFATYAIDGDFNGGAGASFTDGFILSNTADGSGPATTISNGDIVFFSVGGGPFRLATFEGSFVSGDGTVSGFVLRDAEGVQPAYVFSNDTIPDSMS